MWPPKPSRECVVTEFSLNGGALIEFKTVSLNMIGNEVLTEKYEKSELPLTLTEGARFG